MQQCVGILGRDDERVDEHHWIVRVVAKLVGERDGHVHFHKLRHAALLVITRPIWHVSVIIANWHYGVNKVADMPGRTPSAETLTDLILTLFRVNNATLVWGDRLVRPFGLTSARWQIMGAIAYADRPQPGSPGSNQTQIA